LASNSVCSLLVRNHEGLVIVMVTTKFVIARHALFFPLLHISSFGPDNHSFGPRPAPSHLPLLYLIFLLFSLFPLLFVVELVPLLDVGLPPPLHSPLPHFCCTSRPSTLTTTFPARPPHSFVCSANSSCTHTALLLDTLFVVVVVV